MKFTVAKKAIALTGAVAMLGSVAACGSDTASGKPAKIRTLPKSPCGLGSPR